MATYIIVGDQINGGISFGNSPRDSSTKDSGGLRYIDAGQRQSTFNVEGYVDGSNWDKTFEDAYFNETPLGAKWRASEETGDNEYEGFVVVTAFERGGGVEENEAFTATLEVNGIVNVTPIP